MNKIPYPVQSMLLFASFQLILFPLMMSGYITGAKPIYMAGAIQSIAMTSAFNYLVSGSAHPSTVYVWYLIGIPFYALVGLFAGKLLQNRFPAIRNRYKLAGSLAFWVIFLLVLLTVTQRQEIWSLQAGW